MKAMQSAVIALLLVSCGGDDGGIPPDKELGDLEEDEVVELCDGLIQGYRERIDIEAACTLAVLLGSLRGEEPLTSLECRRRVGACAFLGGAVDGETCATALEGTLDGCDATVEDWRRCTDYGIDVTAAIVGGLSCDIADDPSAIEDAVAGSAVGIPPSACLRVAACGWNSIPLSGT